MAVTEDGVDIMRNDRNSDVVPFVTRSICSVAMQPVTNDKFVSYQFMNARDEMGEPKRQDWPETSNGVDCWTCAHSFEGKPCFIPSKKTSAWKVYGCFCSWSCAKRYIIDHPSFENAGQIILLEDLARDSGVTQPIVAAPPMIALRRFGGHMSIEEYRATGQTAVEVVHEPFISHSLVFRHHERGDGGGEQLQSESAPAADQPQPQQRSSVATGRIHGLRRPTKQARTHASSTAPAASADEAHTGGGVYDQYVERRRLLSQQRKKDAPNAATVDEERQSGSSAARPLRRRKRDSAANETASTPPPAKQRKKSGTLAGFIRGGKKK